MHSPVPLGKIHLEYETIGGTKAWMGHVDHHVTVGKNRVSGGTHALVIHAGEENGAIHLEGSTNRTNHSVDVFVHFAAKSGMREFEGQEVIREPGSRLHHPVTMKEFAERWGPVLRNQLQFSIPKGRRGAAEARVMREKALEFIRIHFPDKTGTA